MEFGYELLPTEGRLAAAIQEARDSNGFSEKYGLSLTEPQALMIADRRFAALKAEDRIEFGEGVVKKLVYAFCDSPYIHSSEYAGTLADLQDVFYLLKNESGDRVPDDDLIELMAETFNGRAGGSVEYMCALLAPLCRSAAEGEKWRSRNDGED